MSEALKVSGEYAESRPGAGQEDTSLPDGADGRRMAIRLLERWLGLSEAQKSALEVLITVVGDVTIEPWLYDAVTRDRFPVHERALLMRPLARLDSAAAVAVARMLLDESPWASAELLGMHGGDADLELLDSRLPRYRQHGFAEDRRKLEAAIRKIRHRLVRAGT